MNMDLAIAAVFGYLLGSIPFGLLITRAAGLGDVRKIGSGNIGATNVLRTGRRELAAATLVLDAAKGAAAVLIARYFWGSDAAVVAGVAAFLGHCFPVWLGFKGGKGVATAGGVLLAYAWPLALVAALTWIAMALLFRYSSLAAVTAAIVAPLYAWVARPEGVEPLAVLIISLIVIWRHRMNLSRLARGEEDKIVLGKKRA